MNRRILVAALAVALILITAVVFAYVDQFGPERSANSGDWGQFGDYFAGLLNPIFSLLAFSGFGEHRFFPCRPIPRSNMLRFCFRRCC